MMIVKCGSLDEFAECCAKFVALGLTFEAHTTDFSITLTGGH